MEELKIKLLEYGLVRTCKMVHDDVFTLMITDDYKPTINNMSEIQALIAVDLPEHTVLESIIMEDNMFFIVLKKPSDA